MVRPMMPARLCAAAAACALALAGSVQPGVAQSGSVVDTGTEIAPEIDPPQPGDAAEHPGARATVVFLLPALDEQTQSELRDALLAQFALIDAELVIDGTGNPPGSLGDHMAEAQRRATEHDAIAVIWIDGNRDGRWLVHMMDIERERIVVRPADASGERRASAIEAVAVMARESARALIAGKPMPELAPEPSPVTPAPAPAPPAAPSPPEGSLTRQGKVRLWAGYLGTDFADELPWRHGATVGAAWLGFSPLYAAVSYVFTPALAVESAVNFEVMRIPISMHAGYRQRWDRAVLDIELGLSVEFLRSSGLRGGPETTFEAKQSETQVTWALAPRLRGELTPVPDVGLFAALGLDILLNNFSYAVEQTSSRGTQLRQLLRADDVRPVLELGVAFYP